jgi:hypothetical protein
VGTYARKGWGMGNIPFRLLLCLYYYSVVFNACTQKKFHFPLYNIDAIPGTFSIYFLTFLKYIAHYSSMLILPAGWSPEQDITPASGQILSCGPREGGWAEIEPAH